jgi:subtilase family serine protease
MKSIRHQGELLLAAIVLLSQPVHAQNRNLGHPVVPRDSIRTGEKRPPLWRMSIMDPSALAHGPGDSNCGPSSSQDACYYIPSDLVTAYATNLIPNANGGAGVTIAIVDAYYNSQTANDLATYISATNSIFSQSLPACSTTPVPPATTACLTIVGQTGGTPPAQPVTLTNTIRGWFQEEDLDLQWAHSIAPNANILLVVANSSGDSDLYTAVQYAKLHANVVSDSWGGTESLSEVAADSNFSSSVPILFSSGDTYGSLEYPCASPNVTCVGGTHLQMTATSHRSVESVWDDASTNNGGTSGGCSLYESEPLYQTGFSTCGGARGVPDIAAIADEYTGVLVYLGTNAGGTGSELYLFGGTSLATPIMAAIVANIDASRVAAGKAMLGGSTSGSLFLTQLLYQAAAAPLYHYRFYDVTTGTGAAAGWDDVTGLGVTLNPSLTAYLNSLP